MTESARLSYGTFRWTAISFGKSSGHARIDIDTIGAAKPAASSSSATDAARATDARTSATNFVSESSSSGSPVRWSRCGPPS